MMIDKVRKTVLEYEMISENEKVLVGLSGGADSVALLLALKELGFSVEACHVNHNLRGLESDRDEAFCRELCKKEGITFYSESVDVKGYCEEKKLSTEEGARELRYQALNKHISENTKLATAHTLSDSLETTVLNFVRGTGLKGLCGIPPVRDNIIRPLIFCTREEIEEYLASLSQDFVTDSTNLSDDYTRNKIRHDVIPSMLKLNPSFYKVYEREKRVFSLDAEIVKAETENVVRKAFVKDGAYDAEFLKSLDKPILMQTIIRILADESLPISFDNAEKVSAVLDSGKKVNISKNRFVLLEGRLLRFLTVEAEKREETDVERVELEISKSVKFMEKEISADMCSICEKNIFKNNTQNLLDYDKIKGKLFLRKRKNGDKVKFKGHGHTTSIKKLFNLKIPINQRDKIVFLEDDEGIVFVEGFGTAERVKVDDSTLRILKIDIKGESHHG